MIPVVTQFFRGSYGLSGAPGLSTTIDLPDATGRLSCFIDPETATPVIQTRWHVLTEPLYMNVLKIGVELQNLKGAVVHEKGPQEIGFIPAPSHLKHPLFWILKRPEDQPSPPALQATRGRCTVRASGLTVVLIDTFDQNDPRLPVRLDGKIGRASCRERVNIWPMDYQTSTIKTTINQTS